MIIAIGCDHAGTALKDEIIALLSSEGVETRDMGTTGEASVDYPDFGAKVAGAVCKGEADRGILICGTGIGMSIVANKFKNIRATLCHDTFTARMGRLHNDSNVLVLGSRVTPQGLAREIVSIWLATEYEGGRHNTRINKIKEIEEAINNDT